ncbi:hypothetical protein GHT06_009807 [Daphnia sinensis]|uniref:Uncharacterized protein n=1 Tax=Daphnia sinensis TaxID=1820382 RepID=A0AAD5Q1U0_9CRUS|nr:hypothetical protein GHT06_009807 [Daphnia sinensis]
MLEGCHCVNRNQTFNSAYEYDEETCFEKEKDRLAYIYTAVCLFLSPVPDKRDRFSRRRKTAGEYHPTGKEKRTKTATFYPARFRPARTPSQHLSRPLKTFVCTINVPSLWPETAPDSRWNITAYTSLRGNGVAFHISIMGDQK